MKQLITKKLPALVLALCLIISNAAIAFADTTPASAEPPTVSAISQEITATAQYLKTNAALDPVIDFYQTSRILTLLLRSGVDCTNEVNSYLSAITANYVSNGNLTLVKPLRDYAYLAIILALSGNDPTNFNGINVISKLETAISTADQASLNSINPYNLPHIYLTISAYSSSFTDSTACLLKLKTAILSYATANGINNWGNSADNNGFGLSGLAFLGTSDTAFHTLALNAVAFNQTLLSANGTSASDFTWSTLPNSDSTAASLTLYSEYGYSALAASSYAGLLTFKTAGIPGAYRDIDTSSTANIYATVDVLYGLLSYRSVLSGKNAPFNISDMLVKKPVEPATSAEPSANATTETSVATVATDASENVELSEATTVSDATLSSPPTSDAHTPLVYVIAIMLAACSMGAAYQLNALQKSKNS